MNSLDTWEKRLIPYFNSNLRLIAEIPLVYDDVQMMAEAIKDCLKENRITRATLLLTEKYPLTFITYMSGFAAYNTERNFWQAFADSLGVDHHQVGNQRWHKHYVRLARNRGLRVFDFADDPTPYVTSIRFQGGIPSYSLPDYFSKMVLPAVERQNLRELQPKDALRYLLEHTYFVDSPVFDFLENSGELGVDFFIASCKLAKHANEYHGEILPAHELELPVYVVETFERWWEHREDIKQHWVKPFLQAAPGSEDTAVNLNLPAQEISLELSASRLYWNINYPELGVNEKVECRPSRRRDTVVTEGKYLPIPKPMGRIEVTLLAVREEKPDPAELRRWNLSLLSPAGITPIIGFNEMGIQLSSSRQLPAGALYLLTPLGSELVVDGSIRLVENCIPLEGGWADWQMDCWDLSDAWSVMVVKDGEPLGDVIPVTGIIAQPELVGGHLFQFQDLDEPLYTSDIPSIRVPLVNGNTVSSRLSNWSVQVRSLGEANPSLNRSVRLSEHVEQVRIEDDRGIFPLGHLIGKKSAGTYEIRASGPRGLGAEFRIRLWPKLLLQRHSLKLMQPAHNTQPMEFILCLQEGATCQAQAGAEGIEINQTIGMWQVTVPAELNRALLELHTPADGGGTVRVPVSIPLPKLRWGLATDGHGDTLVFGQTLIHRSIDQLLQAGSSSIHVEMYGLGNLIRNLKLQLVELDDQESVLQEACFYKTDFTNDWLRVTLGQFNGSIRAVKSSAQFELVYSPRDADTEVVRIPLLEVSHALDIRDVALSQISETEWKLTWHEQRPLRNRRVMLLPAWQPWQKPWEYKIPNKARDELILDGIALPPTRYHLYFYVLPDYESALQKPPEGLDPVVIELCTPEERIAAIPTDCASANGKFSNQVELAIINHDLGNGKQRDIWLSEAAKSLIHISKLDLLTGVLEWLKDKDVDKPTKSFFFNSMFHHMILTPMLKHYSPNDPLLIEYLGYTATAKNIPVDSAKLLLKSVNDPVAVASCLRQLFKKKDDELITIMVGMMRESRLSKLDASELLSLDPKWALEKVVEIQTDPVTDTLLSTVLWKVYQLQEYEDDPRVLDWIIRAIPYEEEEQFIEVYLTRLFYKRHPLRFDALMRAYLDEKLMDDEVMEFLSRDPQISLERLKKAPTHDQHQKWINTLIERFPESAGIVKRTSRLSTPFGEGVVDYIEIKNGGQINSIQLSEPDSLLSVLVGEGAYQIRLQIDYHEMTINVIQEKVAWKCTRCNFMHTWHGLVVNHSERIHHAVGLTKINLPVTFSPDDVYII